MKVGFATTKYSVKTVSLALNSIYVINANASYDVNKKDSRNKTGYIVLRTLEGNGTMYIEGIEPIDVLPNTLLVFENKRVNRYHCKGDIWKFWWFEFCTIEKIGLPLNKLLHINIMMNEIHDFNLCLEMLRKGDYESKALSSAIFNQVIYKWLYQFSNNKNKKRNRHYDSINKVIDVLHRNIGTKVTVREMADIAGLSERRFRQVFTQGIGKQPKKYYDDMRLEMAEGLIRNTSMTINEISIKLGYSSQYHFSREFKKHYGVAPSKY